MDNGKLQANNHNRQQFESPKTTSSTNTVVDMIISLTNVVVIHTERQTSTNLLLKLQFSGGSRAVLGCLSGGVNLATGYLLDNNKYVTFTDEKCKYNMLNNHSRQQMWFHSPVWSSYTHILTNRQHTNLFVLTAGGTKDYVQPLAATGILGLQGLDVCLTKKIVKVQIVFEPNKQAQLNYNRWQMNFYSKQICVSFTQSWIRDLKS